MFFEVESILLYPTVWIIAMMPIFIIIGLLECGWPKLNSKWGLRVAYSLMMWEYEKKESPCEIGTEGHPTEGSAYFQGP